MLYIVLVNWNSGEDTISCVQSLIAARHGPMTVLICDNASTDHSVEKISLWANKELCPVAPPTMLPARARTAMAWDRLKNGPPVHVVLVINESNLGFAGGNNIGIKIALEDTRCRHIFLLNNDTEIHPDALVALEARMMADPSIALCGATLVYHGRPDTLQGLGGVHNRFRARARTLWGEQPLADLPEEGLIDPKIDYVIGAAIFARSDVLRRTGGLCEDYFLYYEELDLSRQLLPGERMAWARDAIVWHKVGGSLGTGQGRSRASDLSIYYDHRSKIRFYFKYLRRHVLFLAADIIRTMLAYLRKGDLTAVRIILLAILDYAIKPANYRRNFSVLPRK